MINEPLGLPAGSIRAIITLLLTITIIALLLFDVKLPDELFSLWLVAVGYYIGIRNFSGQKK